ncbi:hypothetical protein PIROE2DRAFT_15761 [Piromyces sp. E2]|nr:hypothetical protein PIROE2DRAFT_15761 [Piromyces sp. E2]|eukprot:OUM58861.1 hypothetical protein PIROE2DRAFT_15761 [Piromyces sp. E2]
MSSFENKDDVLTIFIHLEYLDYDREKNEIFILNKEVHEEFENCTKSSNCSIKIYYFTCILCGK